MVAVESVKSHNIFNEIIHTGWVGELRRIEGPSSRSGEFSDSGLAVKSKTSSSEGE
jgi:hypothetical protein